MAAVTGEGKLIPYSQKGARPVPPPLRPQDLEIPGDCFPSCLLVPSLFCLGEVASEATSKRTGYTNLQDCSLWCPIPLCIAKEPSAPSGTASVLGGGWINGYVHCQHRLGAIL